MPRPEQINFPGFEIDANDLVVDVGCGDGLVCGYAARMGADVIGIEVDPIWLERVDAAMRGLPARSWRAILSDCDPIPLPDAVASVVVSTEVLEHVADPARVLAELVRIGRTGARYLISVPDPASETVMRVVAPRWYWEPPYHRRVIERATLDRMLREAGLEVEARHAGGFYWSMWWIFRMSLGARPFEPTPDAPLLQHWEKAWAAFLETPDGVRAAAALDRLVPKSQILIARKVGSPAAARPWWQRRLRQIAARLRRSGAWRLGRTP